MYVMVSWGDQIQTFEIAAATGALTIRNTLGGYDRPIQAVIPPSGRYLYVAVENTNIVYRFSLQASNGFPVSPQSYQKPLPAPPRGMALHPSGEGLFLMSADGTIASFSVDSGSGTLAYLAQTSSNNAEWLAVTADGRHAYGVSSGAIQVFSIDPTTLGVTNTGQTELPGVGTYQRSLTLY
jgi:6-phosphogluconolactonase (cycloisomerase 2 family)